MPPEYHFLSDKDVQEIRQLLREVKDLKRELHGVDLPPGVSPDNLFAKPPDGMSIPAMQNNVPGELECCLYTLEVQPGGGRKMVAVKHAPPSNYKPRLRVYNIWPTTVVSYVPIHKDKHSGRWFCEQGYGGSTPTTRDPSTPPPKGTAATAGGCGGRCKFVWSESNKRWSEALNECASVTTTSTTEEPTTTTTEDPCACPTTTTREPSSTTTGDPTSTTTSFTTTTTADPGCKCVFPEHCGSTDGEITYTYCAQGLEPVEPSCGQAADCPTTTTTACPSGGCWFKWGLLSNNHWQWVPYSHACPVLNADSRDCHCHYPNKSGTFACEEAWTPCLTDPVPCPQCEGTCLWYWAPMASDWVLMERQCHSSNLLPNCLCPKPSVPGNTCGQREYTKCQLEACTDEWKSYTHPCNPCYACVSTTTTTATPCNSYCKWRWLSAAYHWNLTGDPCNAACPCSPPSFDGTENDEVTWVRCAPRPTTTAEPSTTTSTTTTTAEPTTTTTTAPTTTTTCATGGGVGCLYRCLGTSVGWGLVSGSCGADYQCLDPKVLGLSDCLDSDYGYMYHICCVTTTTTTTTTTLAPCEGDCIYKFNAEGVAELQSSDCDAPCGCFEVTLGGSAGQWMRCDCERNGTAPDCVIIPAPTTTTTALPYGYCRYECVGESAVLLAGNCPPGYTCPGGSCMPEGMIWNEPCVEDF